VVPERRTDIEIRGEMASEREELDQALADLRAGIESKRRVATAAAALAAAGLAAVASIKVARRLR
jgi:hypothetical protein